MFFFAYYSIDDLTPYLFYYKLDLIPHQSHQAVMILLILKLHTKGN